MLYFKYTAFSIQLTAMKSLKEKIIRLSDEIAQQVYPLTYKFPREEKFALGDQLRRSIISVPANIIEGSARSGEKELKQFLNIAYSSLKEAKYLLYFAFKQGFIREKDYQIIKIKTDELSKLLYVFLQRLKK